ncbi:MAG: thiosulfate oxidation carrier protein SoxY, partial [Betaproteobacteria bacterium]|nr:thiosulfate oxidation carrier protein SoxY [Betaproteobacteria bacterium]
MNHARRKALKTGGGAGVLAMLFAAGVLKPGDSQAQTWNESAFSMKSVPEAMRALGAQNPAAS